MKYMLLIYTEAGSWQRKSEEERHALYREYYALDDELRAGGRLVDTSELQPSSTATTVRVRDGKPLVTDGPFPETKEQLGGYYVVECESLDEALEIAERIPSAREGAVEVRPLVER